MLYFLQTAFNYQDYAQDLNFSKVSTGMFASLYFKF